MKATQPPKTRAPAGGAAAGRRAFLGGGVAALATTLIGRRLRAADLALAAPGQAATTPGQAATARDPEVTIENFSAAGKSLGTARVAKVIKSEAEWRAQLSPLAFRVARQAGTETAFSGEYDHNPADGVYRCICCDTALYDSRTKFDSGTGWPSFWRPISSVNVVKSSDSSFGMQRDAISCRLCDAHLGHVFDDGPRPTGLRYCMNSVSLRFVKRA
jgi:peptide-methionine (R)-S-oxide reductase